MLLPENFLLILIKLCIAHLISDYFLQFKSWVTDKEKNKIRSSKLYAHIAVTFIAAGLISGEWLIAVFIAVSHGLIDTTKIYLGRKDGLSFIIDQLSHFIILIICSLWLSGEIREILLLVGSFSQSISFWAITLGYLLVTFPMSVVVGILAYRWRKEINLPYEELKKIDETGKWVGIMERLFILTFILLNQYTVIGLLLIAKAIFRMGNADRKFSEYVLVGTFLSTLITVIIGLMIKIVSLA